MPDTKPDILIHMSDQQDGRLLGCVGNEDIRTPNIDRLASRGTAFSAAYTSCPICVPARAGFLTGQHPSVNDVYGNDGAIGEDHATFLHSLVAQGYETVLVGRMHFVGPDQRHGFTKRIGGDFCHMFWPDYSPDDEWMQSMGPYLHTTGSAGALRVAGGGGVSPGREYDLQVAEWALNYLSEDHDRPQCVVVGTYGPHFPYVAKKNLFEYYRENATLPDTFQAEGEGLDNPFYGSKQQYPDADVALAAQAAYRGLIEEQDELFGRIMSAWEEYRERSGRPGLTIYTSDHGDTCGDHNLYGKTTFYEGSTRIPLIVAGDGLDSGEVVDMPVSLLDVAPTVLDMTDGMRLPTPAGESLVPIMTGSENPTDRAVISEFIYNSEETGPCPARMVRKGDWKLMHYAHGQVDDMLFNLREDPEETRNRNAECDMVAGELRKIARAGWDPEEMARRKQEKGKHHRILTAAGERVGGPPEECWMEYADRLELPDAEGSHISQKARDREY